MRLGPPIAAIPGWLFSGAPHKKSGEGEGAEATAWTDRFLRF